MSSCRATNANPETHDSDNIVITSNIIRYTGKVTIEVEP